jgi:hypothetical protein
VQSYEETEIFGGNIRVISFDLVGLEIVEKDLMGQSQVVMKRSVSLIH